MVGNTSYITFTISSIKKELYFTILCLILISSIKYYELPPKPIQPPSFYEKVTYLTSYLYTLLILINFIVIFFSAITMLIKK